MFIKFTVDVVLGSGLGFVAGSFAPSVGRKIKALFVKDTQAARMAVLTDITKVKSAVAEEAKDVTSRL